MAFYEVGTRVVWESQASGSTVRKEGVVVATSDDAKGESPVNFARRMFDNHRLMFDGLRWHKYGVLVSVAGGNKAKAKPKLYMPRPGVLSRPID